jgi:site-specific DNA recombinase
VEQTERWLDTGKGKEQVATVDLEVMRKEIENLKQKEDRYSKAYAYGVFDLPKLKEYTAPIREKVNSLEYQMARANQEQAENGMAIPSPYEVEEFAKEAREKLKNLNFEAKRRIVVSVIDKIIGTPEKLSVYGYIPLNNQQNQNVTLCSKHRHSRAAKCREIDAL